MKRLFFIFGTFLFSGILLINSSCVNKRKSTPTEMQKFEQGTYGYDYAFLKQYGNPVELKQADSRVVVSPGYQGRVMTSTAGGNKGRSYGWINHDLIASGEIPKHIYPVGGEERFWLGPEGGQFSVFFENGSTFEYANWQTPAAIDTDTYPIVAVSDTEVEFRKSIQLKNYSNFLFDFEVTRNIQLLDREAIHRELGLTVDKSIRGVGYRTTNKLKNTGDIGWKKETGLLSIWLLGMFNPSDEVTIFIPYNTTATSDYVVKDDYFGKIPSDRLQLKNGIVFLKGDGKHRGKLGIPPQRALPFLGSYDAQNQVLTVVKCDLPEEAAGYVNSAWEMQEFPYRGDAINAYNDGPLEDGTQMGPFYELESSSPALALQPDEVAVHKQATFHFEGSEEKLDAVCEHLFGISLQEIKSIF